MRKEVNKERRYWEKNQPREGPRTNENVLELNIDKSFRGFAQLKLRQHAAYLQSDDEKELLTVKSI
jgi:hypothetical protein